MRELSGVPEDTSEKARDIVSSNLRNMSPEEKLLRLCQLSAFYRSLVFDGICSRYPNASDQEVRARFARRVLSLELAEKYYPFPDLDTPNV